MLSRKTFITAAVLAVAASVALGAAAIRSAPSEASSSTVWLEKIMRCESGGDPRAVNENKSETHSNGQIGSYGLFQFGFPTWQYIVKQADRLWPEKGYLNYIHIYPDEAEENIQWMMARLLWDDGEGAHHWRNCAAQTGWDFSVPAE